ncbi:5667_t:CDS:1, partial [Funneliformis geosporum]
VDSQGLISKNRKSPLAEHKKIFVRANNGQQPGPNLNEIIAYIKPTILIGLSGKKEIFTPAVLGLMAKYNPQPIIFALSNPETNSECSLSAAMQHTNQQVIFASGTAFPDYSIPPSNKIYPSNQANNMYIFPGLELGILATKLKTINDLVVYKAAKALAASLNASEKKAGYLYPDLSRLPAISRQIAATIVNLKTKS